MKKLLIETALIFATIAAGVAAALAVGAMVDPEPAGAVEADPGTVAVYGGCTTGKACRTVKPYTLTTAMGGRVKVGRVWSTPAKPRRAAYALTLSGRTVKLATAPRMGRVWEDGSGRGPGGAVFCVRRYGCTPKPHYVKGEPRWAKIALRYDYRDGDFGNTGR